MANRTIVNGVYKPTYNWGAPSCNIIPKFLAQLWNLVELPVPGVPVQVERSQNTEDGFQKIREACWCPLTSTLSRNWVAKWDEITKPSKIDLTYINILEWTTSSCILVVLFPCSRDTGNRGQVIESSDGNLCRWPVWQMSWISCTSASLRKSHSQSYPKLEIAGPLLQYLPTCFQPCHGSQTWTLLKGSWTAMSSMSSSRVRWRKPRSP